jgi:hypothetical protein
MRLSFWPVMETAKPGVMAAVVEGFNRGWKSKSTTAAIALQVDSRSD